MNKKDSIKSISGLSVSAKMFTFSEFFKKKSAPFEMIIIQKLPIMIYTYYFLSAINCWKSKISPKGLLNVVDTGTFS